MWMGNEIVAVQNADDNLNVGARYFKIAVLESRTPFKHSRD